MNQFQVLIKLENIGVASHIDGFIFSIPCWAKNKELVKQKTYIVLSQKLVNVLDVLQDNCYPEIDMLVDSLNNPGELLSHLNIE